MNKLSETSVKMSCDICHEYDGIDAGCGCKALYCVRCLVNIDNCILCQKVVFDKTKVTIMVVVGDHISKLVFDEQDNRYVITVDVKPRFPSFYEIVCHYMKKFTII